MQYVIASMGRAGTDTMAPPFGPGALPQDDACDPCGPRPKGCDLERTSVMRTSRTTSAEKPRKKPGIRARPNSETHMEPDGMDPS